MNIHADKTQENKIQSVANTASKNQGDAKSTLLFADNRPEIVAQRKLQEAANNSSQVKQLRAFQDIANDSMKPKQQQPIQRKAKVDKFGSWWKKGPLVDQEGLDVRGRNANLQIRVAAVFSKKDGNDPGDAEYKQFVKDKWEITAPAHRAGTFAESGWHNDNYSKADDAGEGADPALLRTQDYPGMHHSAQRQDGLLPTDNLIATFSAKQQIIDTSNDNEVIAELDEHTATITGTHPRNYKGVPKKVGGG